MLGFKHSIGTTVFILSLSKTRHPVNIGELTLAVGDVGSSKSRFKFSESTSCLLFFILSRRSPVGLSVDLSH